MYVAPLSQFGSEDVVLYRQYLSAVLAGQFLGGVEGDVGVGDGRFAILEQRFVGKQLGETVERILGAVGLLADVSVVDKAPVVFAVGGDDSGVRHSVGAFAEVTGAGSRQRGLASEDKCSRGTDLDSDVGVGYVAGSVGSGRDVDLDSVSVTSGDLSDGREFKGDVYGIKRGKHYERNKARKEKLRQKKFTEAAVGVCPSLSGTVKTVDTRTANEIEAADTLAARRAVENRVAIKLAELRLSSLCDADKTVAVRRLDAARMEQRINDARAKSQASFSKCDNSLKSLGSTGSAGEFALKSALTKQESLQVAHDNLALQVRAAIAAGGDDVRQAVLAIPEPKKCGIRDVMDEPDDSWPEDEVEAYYAILNEEASGNYDSDWAGFLSSNKQK